MRTVSRRGRDPKVARLPRRRLRRIGLRVALTATVVVAGLGAAAWLWTLREVRVVGVERLSALEVHEAAGLRGGERLLLTDLGRVAERVRAIPIVRDATVRRALPATVEIRVVERVPLVRLEGHPELVSDSQGRVFDVAAEVDLPEVAGWRARPRPEPGAGLDPTTAAVLEAFASYPPEVAASVVRIEVGDEITMFVRSGPRLMLGRPVALEAKGAALAPVLADAQQRKLDLEYVDVRAPSAPVVRRRGSSDPEPTPTPAATRETA